MAKKKAAKKNYLITLQVISGTGTKDSLMHVESSGTDENAAAKTAIKNLQLRKNWKAEFTNQFKEIGK